jgi:hypothetical protein
MSTDCLTSGCLLADPHRLELKPDSSFVTVPTAVFASRRACSAPAQPCPAQRHQDRIEFPECHLGPQSRSISELLGVP